MLLRFVSPATFFCCLLLFFSHPAAALTARFDAGLNGVVATDRHWVPVIVTLDRSGGDPSGDMVLNLRLLRVNEVGIRSYGSFATHVTVPDQPRFVFRGRYLQPKNFYASGAGRQDRIQAELRRADGPVLLDEIVRPPSARVNEALTVWVSRRPAPEGLQYGAAIGTQDLADIVLDLDAADMLITDDIEWVRAHAADLTAWQTLRPRGIVLLHPTAIQPESLGLSPSFSRPVHAGPQKKNIHLEFAEKLRMNDKEKEEYMFNNLHKLKPVVDDPEFVRGATNRIVWILMGYVMAAVPALFLYLRRRKQGERIGIGIPLLSAGMVIGILVMAARLHGAGGASHTDTIIYHDDARPPARIFQIWSVKSPEAAQLQVSFDEGAIPTPFYGLSDEIEDPIPFALVNRLFFLPGMPIERWSRQVFFIDRPARIPPIHRRVRLEGDEVVIEAANETTDTYTVYTNGGRLAGTISPGWASEWRIRSTDEPPGDRAFISSAAAHLLNYAFYSFRTNLSAPLLIAVSDRPTSGPAVMDRPMAESGQTIRIERFGRIDEMRGTQGRIPHDLLTFIQPRVEEFSAVRNGDETQYRFPGRRWVRVNRKTPDILKFVLPDLPSGVRVRSLTARLKHLPFDGTYQIDLRAPEPARREGVGGHNMNMELSLPLDAPGETIVELFINGTPSDPAQRNETRFNSVEYDFVLDVSR